MLSGEVHQSVVDVLLGEVLLLGAAFEPAEQLIDAALGHHAAEEEDREHRVPVALLEGHRLASPLEQVDHAAGSAMRA